MGVLSNYFLNCTDKLYIPSFQYVNARAHSSDTAWHFPLHQHEDFLEISLIISGSADIIYDQQHYSVHAGDIVIKNANVIHSEESSLDDPVEQFCVAIGGVKVPGMEPDTILPDGMSPVIPVGDAFDFLYHNFRYQSTLADKSRQVADHPVLQHSLITCCAAVAMLIESDAVPIERTVYSELISEILDYINNNYSEDLSLEFLSRKFYISPYYLSRKFKSEVGVPINQYILSLRLGEAERMLAFEKDPIKIIAEKCGYSNLQYFYSTFRKQTGMTPVEMRGYYRSSLERIEKATR